MGLESFFCFISVEFLIFTYNGIHRQLPTVHYCCLSNPFIVISSQLIIFIQLSLKLYFLLFIIVLTIFIKPRNILQWAREIAHHCYSWYSIFLVKGWFILCAPNPFLCLHVCRLWYRHTIHLWLDGFDQYSNNLYFSNFPVCGNTCFEFPLYL